MSVQGFGCHDNFWDLQTQTSFKILFCRVKETSGKNITQISSLTTTMTICYWLQAHVREKKDRPVPIRAVPNRNANWNKLGRFPIQCLSLQVTTGQPLPPFMPSYFVCELFPNLVIIFLRTYARALYLVKANAIGPYIWHWLICVSPVPLYHPNSHKFASVQKRRISDRLLLPYHRWVGFKMMRD